MMKRNALCASLLWNTQLAVPKEEGFYCFVVVGLLLALVLPKAGTRDRVALLAVSTLHRLSAEVAIGLGTGG